MDVDDLREKLAAHRDRLAVLMVTYPSTHGVFEEQITDVCAAVHEAGGQVYVDGANLNALVGLAKPGRFGADVSHLNLHKTFCIPHGGGGPGVGPGRRCARTWRRSCRTTRCTRSRARSAERRRRSARSSAAPWGSAGILPIPWAYIRLMGAEGLKRATQVGGAGGELRRGAAGARTTRCCTPARRAWWRTSASWICGRSPSGPG